MTTTTTGKTLKSHACDIISGAYETGVYYWAVGLGDYTWSDEDETASVTIFEMGDSTDYEEAYKGKPLHLNETIVADWLKLMGTTSEGIQTLRAQLNDRLVKDIIMLNVANDYDLDWDAFDYDAVIQLITLGEVRYG